MSNIMRTYYNFAFQLVLSPISIFIFITYDVNFDNDSLEEYQMMYSYYCPECGCELINVEGCGFCNNCFFSMCE